MIERLHNINGKLDMIQDLKIQGLGLSLDQQEQLLANTSYTEEQINEMDNWEIEMHLGL